MEGDKIIWKLSKRLVDFKVLDLEYNRMEVIK
jgi:hypothetical protein